MIARARMLGWSAELEEDLSGGPGLFVPGIMGVGILLSVGILLADLQRVAGFGAAARRNSVRRRANELVEPLALALDAGPPRLPPARRSPREREFYVWLFLLSTAFSLYVGVGSTANFLRAIGPFRGVLWMEVLALLTAAVALAVGMVGLSVARRYPRLGKWARHGVERTPLGKL